MSIPHQKPTLYEKTFGKGNNGLVKIKKLFVESSILLQKAKDLSRKTLKNDFQKRHWFYRRAYGVLPERDLSGTYNKKYKT